MIVDAVGVTEAEFNDTNPLERKKGESLKKLLDQVAAGVRDPDVVSSIAGRLARLDRVISAEDRDRARRRGRRRRPHRHRPRARPTPSTSTPPGTQPRPRTAAPTRPTSSSPSARAELIEQACRVAGRTPALREKLIEVRRSYTQVLDETSKDEVIDAGFSRDATDRARQTVESWQAFVDEHKDDIDALQILYSRPYGKRLTLRGDQGARRHHRPTAVQLDPRTALGGVRGARRRTGPAARPGTVLTNLVSLVRHALEPDGELVAYPLTVERALPELARPAGRRPAPRSPTSSSSGSRRIKDHLATVLTIAPDDFELEPFVSHGGFGRANSDLQRSPRPAARRTHPGTRRMTDLPTGWAEVRTRRGWSTSTSVASGRPSIAAGRT